MEFISRSERTKKTWQNPERRIKQSAALKKCWQREDYRARLTRHLREISPKGNQAYTQLRASGALTTSEETRKSCSEGQRRRLQRPEEQKKLEEARRRSFLVIDFQERAKVMHEAFLAKYGSFVELAKMGLKAPKRKPNRLELEVASMLGQEWKYVGKGDLVIEGLIPDFVHRTKKEVLEVLGCYFHACPEHFPNVRMSRTALPSYRESVYKKNGYEVTFIWEHEVRPRKLAFKDAGVGDPSVYAE
jgi:hypothetical protein